MSLLSGLNLDSKQDDGVAEPVRGFPGPGRGPELNSTQSLIPLTSGPFEGKIRQLGLQGSSTTRRWDADASVVSARAATCVNVRLPLPDRRFLFRVQRGIPRRESS